MTPTARRGMVLFETQAVCKYFRAGTSAEVRAVEDVSLAIPAGAFVLFQGASGSGKTTLLALLGGMDRPSRGKVLFAGRDLSDCSDNELARVRRRFGFIFQNFALLPGLPAWENVAYPLIPRGVPRDERFQRAERLLARLGLTNRREAQPGGRAGGDE